MLLLADIAAAFTDLEWTQRYRLTHAIQNPHSSPYRVDRTAQVISRNRYGNVQPWDALRIRLKKPIGGSDYVNASPITLPSRGSEPSSRNASTTSVSQQISQRIQTKYIATQGPKEGQYSHFWHMVMQETPGDIAVIIMLTQLYEGHKEKCAPYFPLDLDNPSIALPAHEDNNEEDDDDEDQDDGDPFLDSPPLSADTDSQRADSETNQDSSNADKSSEEAGGSGTVTLLSSTYDQRLKSEVRRIKLTIGSDSKEVYHYLYNGWPDFGKPEADDRLALLELIKVSRAVANGAPRIVHCSAGVGRTGTWIALDYLLQELEAGRLLEPSPRPIISDSSAKLKPATSHKTWGRSGPSKPSTPDPPEEVDVIFETVNSLREQRMMMVMNELQYGFLYEVLKDAFVEKYAEKETGPIIIEVQEPSPKVARKRSPFGGMFEGTNVGKARSDEDTVSEAETEIMEGEKLATSADAGIDTSDVEDMNDPYSAVAPDTVRRGLDKDRQDDVHDHEVK
jgi:protein-tyrosine phosphatase